jgi:hypothetical protein
MKIDISGDTVSDIVIQDLKGYHEIMKDHPEEDGVCVAIEVVLSHYMNRQDYITWYKDVYATKNEEIIDENP